MTITHEEYTEFVEGYCFAEGTKDRLTLGALGMAGESGEVVDLIKKHLFHGRPLDIDALRLELGDVMWYITLILDEVDTSLESIMEDNVRKLCERHGRPLPESMK